MSLPRIWWLDDYDRAEAMKKLADVRSQLSDWDWIRFSDEDYKGPKEACKALCREVGILPMFHKGKALYSYGIPRHESYIAEALTSGDLHIPPTAMFVIIAETNRNSSIYKAITAGGDKSLVSTKVATITESQRLSADGVVKWLISRAEARGFKMDTLAARMIVDAIGTNLNRLGMELEKLTCLAPGDTIHSWVVEQGCCGDGESDIKVMCSAILSGNRALAHEHLRRVMAKEPPMRMMAWIRDWLTRMALAETYFSLDQASKNRLLAARKWRKGSNDKWASMPMFPNPSALNYARSELVSAKKPAGWALWGLYRMRELDVRLKVSKPFWIQLPSGERKCIFPPTSKEEIMHDFVESLIA
jgi:hypothetical protein